MGQDKKSTQESHLIDLQLLSACWEAGKTTPECLLWLDSFICEEVVETN